MCRSFGAFEVWGFEDIPIEKVGFTMCLFFNASLLIFLDKPAKQNGFCLDTFQNKEFINLNFEGKAVIDMQKWEFNGLTKANKPYS